ncbi:MAG: alpha/beta fold hydrolase [Albidovulum sp.]|uniref:alpha/beta hydrolase n=1 Tax=Albidovulum sp. TaxID=1872424 RepID=UPI003CA68095
MARMFAGFLIVLTLAACETRGRVIIVPDATKTAGTETVFVGSTRGMDPETGVEFGYQRSPSTRYARLDVAIPPDRVPGEIHWTAPNRQPDLNTDFVATNKVVYSGSADFRSDLATALAREKRDQREVVLFVHGFNNTFAEGAYRLAQLGHDLDLNGVLVNYAWPSRGHPLGYAYDRDSALFARDGLEDLLDEVIAAGAERVLIVSHSLGSALVMETLRQIAIGGNDRVRKRIGGVVLISPDIDVDVFRAQAARIGKLPEPFLIFTSKKDRILALSARLTGQRDRLGNLTDVEEIANLDVTLLDTTAFSQGVGHFNPGNSPALLVLLSRITDVDTALAAGRTGRPGLLPGVALTVQNATQIVLSPVTGLQP